MLHLPQEFIEVCILCGCDYIPGDGIRGVGPTRALAMIRKHKNIEVRAFVC